MSSKLKIAVQKSGRLFTESLTLLRAADLNFPEGKSNALLSCQINNFPAELLFLRDDDIPQYVRDGIADAGIVGLNVVAESETRVQVADTLNFGRCRLSLAVPKESEIQTVEDLSGKRIATSHPNLRYNFLRIRRIESEVVTLSGSVELGPSLGIADAIFDIVSSGGTLIANNLREIGKVMDSQAVLIANPNMDEERQKLLAVIKLRLKSVRNALRHKYVALNAPDSARDRILEILPGDRKPTILSLTKPGWCAIHTALPAEELWEKIEALQAAGAEEIVVSQIEQLFI